MLSTYYLRALACKWSGYSSWLFVSFIDSYGDADGCDLMLIDIYVLTDSIDEFPLSVQDTWQIMDVDGINGPPGTPY
jgi:hypothetical protein